MRHETRRPVSWLAGGGCRARRRRNRRTTLAATKRACGVEECFFERDVRDFEVIDQTHLIVYTGSQRCAFHVELRGTLCDLTFAPELYFSRTNEIPDRDAGGGERRRAGRRPVRLTRDRQPRRPRPSHLRERSQHPSARRPIHGVGHAPTSAGPLRQSTYRLPSVDRQPRSPTISSSRSSLGAASCRRCRRWAPARSRSANKTKKRTRKT